VKRKRVAVAAATAGLVITLIVTVGPQSISAPFLAPTTIEFDGLQSQYPVNGSINFSVSLKGYGSNCIAFRMELIRHDSSDSAALQRVAYYDKIDDCRKISIVEGSFNYTKDFSYNGSAVLGKTGHYTVQVTVTDQITKLNVTSMRSFTLID
jgi:hypothetical protein